jgi:predicted aspartyl protease
MLDTGASASVVDSGLAKELGLRAQGKEKMTGTGGGAEVDMIAGVSFTLPGVKVFNLQIASIGLDPLSAMMGRTVGGIIGYDLIKHFVVEVDYAAGIMNLYTPGRYKYSRAGEILPIKFSNGKPIISAKITAKGNDAVEGRFMIDTGADISLVIHRPFVEVHKLLDSVTQARQGNIGGAGGMSRALTVRIASIHLGRFVISNPIVTLSQATVGTEARADLDGELGGEIFRRFTLILDYSRQRVIFEPNEHLAEPVEEDMSGLELAAEGDGYKTLVINEVLANSPASEAALQEEDELTAINGRPVSDIGLEQIRQMLKQEGKEYLLSIKRGEQTWQVKIKLRRLI